MRYPWEDEPERIIEYLNSPAGEDWSRRRHQHPTGYGPASGYMFRVFSDESRATKARCDMWFSIMGPLIWDDIPSDKILYLKVSDTPPEHV